MAGSPVLPWLAAIMTTRMTKVFLKNILLAPLGAQGVRRALYLAQVYLMVSQHSFNTPSEGYPRSPHSDEGLIPRANIFYIGSDP